MKLATRSNLIEFGLGGGILVIAFLAFLYHHSKAMTASSEVTIVNELKQQVTVLDLTKNEAVATVPANGRWSRKMALGSHDDGSSSTSYRFLRAKGEAADIKSMDLYLKSVRLAPNGIELIKLDGSVSQSVQWGDWKSQQVGAANSGSAGASPE